MWPRNDAAAPGHVCPGIRIHAIDIVQPPGIGISPIADMFLDGGEAPGLYAPELGRNDPPGHGGYGPIIAVVE